MLRLSRLLPLLLVACSLPVAAQEREVPYWASIRAETVNMRVGPGPTYPIEWVFRRPGLPLKVVRVMQGWRLVRDPDGAQGWIVGRLLTRERGALVVGQGLADLREEPARSSALRWRAQPGVVGRLGDCEEGWCEFDVAGRSGWIEQRRIWGAGEP
jgi:SH3-like domain-containing protein